MKKRIATFCILFTIVLSVFIVSADVKKIGDIIGNVLYTDIKTYIDGYEIESYNIGGKTVIPVEELKRYGFGVKWDAKGRKLEVSSPATSTISGKITLPEGVKAPKGGVNVAISALVNPNPNGMILKGMNLWGTKGCFVTIPEGQNSIEYSMPVLLEFKDDMGSQMYKNFVPKYVMAVHYDWLVGNNKAERDFYDDKTLDLSTGPKTNIDFTIDIGTK